MICAAGTALVKSRCGSGGAHLYFWLTPAHRGYAGLLAGFVTIAATGEGHRDILPDSEASAHGTNPASAHMAGMRVVVSRL
ncbi:hypothetical protein KCP70_06630 [Salmonella enterica subsp. enterica]|nr:hypothetical protein KCP70_06630 [Salmonella enterica subsp. enterica]